MNAVLLRMQHAGSQLAARARALLRMLDHGDLSLTGTPYAEATGAQAVEAMRAALDAFAGCGQGTGCLRADDVRALISPAAPVRDDELLPLLASLLDERDEYIRVYLDCTCPREIDAAGVHWFAADKADSEDQPFVAAAVAHLRRRGRLALRPGHPAGTWVELLDTPAPAAKVPA